LNSGVGLLTDSTADLPSHLAEALGIAVVPLTVTLDGQSYLDGVDLTAADFYLRLRSSSGVATTSQPSPARFAEAYERLLEHHSEVVSLHLSSRLSGTFAAAQQGAEMVGSNRVTVVDSAQVSMPLALLVLAAQRLAQEGLDGPQILQRLAPVRAAVHVYFMVATLQHLLRGGRIGRATALLGGVLQVRPLLTIEEGVVAPLERVRTSERALSRLGELARAAFPDRPLCAIIGQADAEEAAERLMRELDPSPESLIVLPLGPVVGAHAGPGTAGLGFYPADLLPLGLGHVGLASRA